MTSEPAKVVGLTLGALMYIYVYLEEPCPRKWWWDTNTQIRPRSEFQFRTVQHSDSSAHKLSKVAAGLLRELWFIKSEKY